MVELLVGDGRIVLVMDAAGGLGQAVGHDGAGADDGVGQPGVDHFAQHAAHLRHGHGAGNRHHDGTFRVGGHGREDLEGLAQVAAAKGRPAHPAQQVGQAGGGANVERFQRLEAVFAAVVQFSHHGPISGYSAASVKGHSHTVASVNSNGLTKSNLRLGENRVV